MPIEWLDGRLLDEAPASICGEPGGERVTCITTARVTAGKARHLEHHIRRLSRDARTLDLGEVDSDLVTDAFATLGREVFGGGSGIVRVEALSGSDPATPHLHATTRPLGDETPNWSALTAPMTHHGPQEHAGAKLGHCPLYEDARAYARTVGANEVLLFDAKDRLVEGAVSNVLIVSDDGMLSTPDLALGAVAGIALEILREQVPEIVSATIKPEDLASAREIIVVNAVRGARPIVVLDEAKVGSGAPGAIAQRLDAILSSDDSPKARPKTSSRPAPT